MSWIFVDKPNHRSKSYKWVKVVAEIKENSTGEVVEYDTNEILHNGDKNPDTFNWAENNFSCNCNRHNFFRRSKGMEDEDVDCGDGMYSVNLKNAKNGEYYYQEFV